MDEFVVDVISNEAEKGSTDPLVVAKRALFSDMLNQRNIVFDNYALIRDGLTNNELAILFDLFSEQTSTVKTSCQRNPEIADPYEVDDDDDKKKKPSGACLRCKPRQDRVAGWSLKYDDFFEFRTSMRMPFNWCRFCKKCIINFPNNKYNVV